MTSISSIGIALPSHKVDILGVFNFMKSYCLWSEDESAKYKLLYLRSGIEYKYSVLSDFYQIPNANNFFNKNENQTTHSRLEIYKKEAIQLAINSTFDALGKNYDFSSITHLITVSCTGFWAPGLDIQLVKELGLKTNIERTSVNFMGCYAAIHALKMAYYISKSNKNAKILIVSVELCTLHFQANNTMDNIAANLLFGDGAASVLIENDEKNPLKIKEFYSDLDLLAEQYMSWNIAQNGFEMTLAKEIPEVIERNITKFVRSSLNKSNIDLKDVENWAIHPGGRKILDTIKKSFSLNEIQIIESYQTLKNYGNMSSATILFVLKEILEKKLNKPIFCAAFGPGLTMESMVLGI
ncbi:MAG: type III polyketide synthase [Cytophagales bacterium]|nr:MAG: type III polyketide synthase [Cytophagales bacterium]